MSDTSPKNQDALTHNAPKAARRQPEPGELLFEFLRGHDRFRCELRDHGTYGVEAQFLQNEEFLIGRIFHPSLDVTRTSREMAIAWAEEERKAIALTDGR